MSDVEVYGLVSDAKSAFVHFMRIHNEAVVQGQTLEFRRLDEPDDEILAAAIPKFGTGSTSRAEPCWPKWKWTSWGQNLVPQRGDKKKLLDMALRNTPVALRDKHAQLEQVDPDAARDRLMEAMMHDLRLKKHPVHMECFDNSSIHGTNPASRGVPQRQTREARLPQIQHPDGRGAGRFCQHERGGVSQVQATARRR